MQSRDEFDLVGGIEMARTILLVEDEAVIAMNEAAILADEGYEVITAYSGEDAINKTRSASGRIDLILMDIDLGRGIDGTEAAVQILAENDIPVLFLSSHSERAIVDKTERISSYGYVMKSSGETVLKASIKMAFKLHEANKNLRSKHAHLEAVTRELAEKEAKYRFLAEKMNDIVWTLNSDLKITYISPSLERIMGYTPSEWICLEPGRRIDYDSDVLIGKVISEELLGKYPAGAENEKTVTLEAKYFHKDGSPRWLENVITGIRDEKGNLTILGVSRDITERKKEREELEKTRALLEAAVEQSPAGILIADAPDVKIRMVNPAGLVIRGMDEEHLSDIPVELHAQRWQTFRTDGTPYPPEELPLSRAVLKGETVRDQELIIRRVDYEDRWILATSAPVMDSRGDMTAGIVVFQDITERKKTEEALRLSEERLRTLINAMPDIVCFKDGEGRWIEANEFDLKLFELEGVPYRGRKDSELAEYSSFYRDAFLTCEETDERAWAAGALSRADEVIPRPDGTSMVFDIIKLPTFTDDGRRKGLIVVGRDITERKKAEVELRTSEERWEFALEGAGDGVWDWNAQTNKVYYSRQWKAMLGYEECDIGEAFNAWELRVHPDDLDEALEKIKRHFDGEDPVYICEHRIRCKDGKYKWILARGKVISRTDEGRPLRVIGTHADISSRKKAEEELKRSISEKEILMRELQHRVKNNLSIVTSLLAIETGKLHDENSKKIFKGIHSRIRSMSELYNELYQSSEIDCINLRKYLDTIARSIIEISSSEAERIRLITSLEDIHLDMKRTVPLALVLNELIINSIKHAFPPGREGEIRLALKKSGDMISMSVSDDGPGVQAEPGTERGGSMGLGLINMLAEQLEGTFSVESGKGTTATLTFRE
jgi:PAS domain S-box-containing protein